MLKEKLLCYFTLNYQKYHNTSDGIAVIALYCSILKEIMVQAKRFCTTPCYFHLLGGFDMTTVSCHRATEPAQLAAACRRADVIVSAAGKYAA